MKIKWLKKTCETIKLVFVTIVSPEKSYQNIKINSNWALPLTLLIAFTSLIYFINILLMLKITRNSISENLIHLIKDEINSKIVKGHLISIAFVVLQILFITVIIWLLIRIINSNYSFKHLLTFTVYSNFILFLQSLVISLILSIKAFIIGGFLGKQPLRLGADIFFSNANLSLSESIVLSNINIFTIWWTLYVIYGISNYIKISIKRSLLVLSIFWIIWLVVQIGMGSLMLAGSLTK